MSKLLSRAYGSSGHASSEHGDEHLTEREMEVLRLAGAGRGNKEIAQELSLSLPTVKAHLVNIFNKMAVGSRTEAVLHAVRRGWIQVDEVTPADVLPGDAAEGRGVAPHDHGAGRAAHRSAPGGGKGRP